MGRKTTTDEQIRAADSERAALQRFIDARGLVRTDWARRANISEGTLRNFLARTSHSMSAATWKALAEAERVSVSEILGETSNPPQFGRSEVDFSRQLPVERGEVDLPVLKMPMRATKVIGDVQAGVYREALEWPPEDQYDVMAEVPAKAARYTPFGLKVVGPSMNLVFPEGSIAVCVRLIDLGEEYEIPNDTFVVVLRRNGDGADAFEATIKQLERRQDGTAWLWPRSNHPLFQAPLPYPTDGRDPEFRDDAGAEDVRIWAVAVAVHRPLPF